MSLLRRHDGAVGLGGIWHLESMAASYPLSRWIDAERSPHVRYLGLVQYKTVQSHQIQGFEVIYESTVSEYGIYILCELPVHLSRCQLRTLMQMLLVSYEDCGC